MPLDYLGRSKNFRDKLNHYKKVRDTLLNRINTPGRIIPPVLFPACRASLISVIDGFVGEIIQNEPEIYLQLLPEINNEISRVNDLFHRHRINSLNGDINPIPAPNFGPPPYHDEDYDQPNSDPLPSPTTVFYKTATFCLFWGGVAATVSGANGLAKGGAKALGLTATGLVATTTGFLMSKK